MTTNPIGLYVHIPFCIRKCNYCDFCSFPVNSISYREEYIDALCREIESYAERKIHVDSIFFGGGTPTVLNGEEMEKIFSAIRSSFVISPEAEITAEANPGTVDEQKLKKLVLLGVNRLSIGLQSIHENELKILGRIHSYDDFLKTYSLARRCGIANINIDLMYGIPEQTKESFAITLDKILSIDPEHISLYGLILEEGTPLYENKSKLTFPDEDMECDMYYYATRFLRDNGYSHYEISNYAKDGKECRHNLKYWRCEEYIGVGLSAYSYFDGYRFGNTHCYDAYLQGDYTEYANREAISNDSLAYEFVMLGLRTSYGISLEEYKQSFGNDFVVGREDKINTFINNGYAEISEGRFHLTEKGFYVSNTILTELI